jgi:hypothetical protein
MAANPDLKAGPQASERHMATQSRIPGTPSAAPPRARTDQLLAYFKPLQKLGRQARAALSTAAHPRRDSLRITSPAGDRAAGAARRRVQRIPRALTAMPLTLAAASAVSTPALASSAWSIQPTPNPTGVSGSALEGVACRAALACIAVGDYTDAAGTASGPLAEQWAGVASMIQPNSQRQYLTGAYCVPAGVCTAVGPGAYGWNGTAWSTEPTPSEGNDGSFLHDVSCTAANACTAVGAYSVYEQHCVFTFSLAERWNCATWSIQPTPNPTRYRGALDGVSCTSADACTAVGFYTNTFVVYVALAERWRGSAWAIDPRPIESGDNVLEDLACTANNACTAVGWSSDGALVERWNGVAWPIQSTPTPTGAAGSVTLSGVFCTTARTCTAVGRYSKPPGTQVTLAESYSG